MWLNAFNAVVHMIQIIIIIKKPTFCIGQHLFKYLVIEFSYNPIFLNPIDNSALCLQPLYEFRNRTVI